MSVIEWDADSRFRLLGQQWSPSFFSLAAIEPDKFEEGGNRLGTYNYFTFATWVGDNMRFKFRVPFTYGTAGTDRFNGDRQNPAQFEMQDVILALQSNDFWILPFDISQYWEGRLYLPTSATSTQQAKIGTLRNEIIFTKMFTRNWGLEYDQKVMYHMQSRTAYSRTSTNELGFTETKPTLTKSWEVDHWVNAYYKFENGFSLGWKLGGEDEWRNQSAANRKQGDPRHYFKTGPSVRFTLTKKASFLLSLDDKVEDTNRSELGKFLAKNTQVVLLSFITL